MKTITAVLALAALSACVSSGTKVTEAQAGQFEKGKATEAEVIAKLGPPTTATRAADGSRSDAYLYTQAQARAASYIPVVGLMAGGADGTATVIMFNFTPDGVLKDWTSSVSNTSVNTGLANQK